MSGTRAQRNQARPIGLQDELDDSLGFLITDAARYGKRLLYNEISEYGIRGGYWYFLRTLWQEDGCSQRELADRLSQVEPSVLEMVRAMERDGLVERRHDPNDRRKRLVFLTEKAKKLHGELMEIVEWENDLIRSVLTLPEQILLKKNLIAIRNRLADELANSTKPGKAAADGAADDVPAD